mgnify:CR=1 FL=1|nr:ATP-binding protein [uncultured Blautia sp.]
MDIIRGKIPCAKKVVVYGPEGIGKSTFASQFPDPVFIDTEGSTSAMDVARLPKATSWQMLLDQINYVKTHPETCKTLVIDTIDWAEQMCVESICDKHQKSGIEDFGYGNGYVYTKEEFGRFLNKLSELVERETNVVLTAHAQIRKFEQPDELGAYDRWELKLGKKTSSQTSPLVKEWADMLLFANYKTISVAVDDRGKKHKAQGGRRIMYTAHHPCWDAKNRYGLPDEVPFEYSSIAHIIDIGEAAPVPRTAPTPAPVPTPAPAQEPAKAQASAVQETAAQPQSESKQMNLPLNETEPSTGGGEEPFPPQDKRIPKNLRDLMEANRVDEWELSNIVEAKGYVPVGTPIWEYDNVNPGIIDGLLVAAWGQVFAAIKDMREKQEIPFEN